ncbi:MAG: phytanoyl-CoA dioxygenase family protein [Pseudoxanthomonas sp.]
MAADIVTGWLRSNLPTHEGIEPPAVGHALPDRAIHEDAAGMDRCHFHREECMSAIVKQSPYELRMTPLKTANHLIGDRAALDEAWDRDGYWFFKDALDKGAIAHLRNYWIRELEKQGVIDPVGDNHTDKSVHYNGASLDRFPFRMEPLVELAPWKAFVAEKPINDFFARVFGVDPFWVPIAEYRAVPPIADKCRIRFDAIHQDGPYSPGIPFRICWIPLAEITQDIGGMAVCEGLTEKVNRHPLVNGTNTAIPPESLPDDRWRHTTCQAGDVLLMNMWTPHSGLSNISDRFRLSIDLRVMETSPACPIVGHVVAITSECVTVKDASGERTFSIDDATYVRNTVGQKLIGDAISDFYRPGSPVILAHDNGRASVVRPPH